MNIKNGGLHILPFRPQFLSPVEGNNCQIMFRLGLVYKNSKRI